MSRTAQVKRDARIGEAEAGRDSGIKVSTDKLSKLVSDNFTVIFVGE